MELKNGFVKLGGDVSRGTGNFILDEIKIKKIDFNDKTSFINYITKGEAGMDEVTTDELTNILNKKIGEA